MKDKVLFKNILEKYRKIFPQNSGGMIEMEKDFMKFNYLNDSGQKLTSVMVDNKTKEIKIENFTDDIINCAFGVKTTVSYEEVLSFLESRCIPRDRSKIKELLYHVGLHQYDPLKICKMTEGRSAQDDNWIEFLED